MNQVCRVIQILVSASMNISPEMTLKETLSSLVDRYSLSEVLDRLVELSDFCAESEPSEAKWNELTKTLEAATRQAKQLESRLQNLQSNSNHL